MKEKIAILISIYNADKHKYYKKTIDSIKEQTYNNYKLYIINDWWENNKTLNYINKNIEDIIIINNKDNIWLALSLNIWLSLIKEKYIARIDIWDIMYKNRLKKQLDFLLQNKLTLIWSNVIEFNDNWKKIKHFLPEKNSNILKNIFKKFVLIHPAIFFNKNDIIKVWWYNNNYKTEDLDLYFRLLKKWFKLWNHPDFLTSYITDDDWITNNSVKEMKRSRAILRLKNLIYFFNIKNIFYTSISLIWAFLPLKIYNFINNIYKSTFLYK